MEEEEGSPFTVLIEEGFGMGEGLEVVQNSTRLTTTMFNELK